MKQGVGNVVHFSQPLVCPHCWIHVRFKLMGIELQLLFISLTKDPSGKTSSQQSHTHQWLTRQKLHGDSKPLEVEEPTIDDDDLATGH
jgi:hypothetical protein